MERYYPRTVSDVWLGFQRHVRMWQASSSTSNHCTIKPVALSLVRPYAESFIRKSRDIPAIPELFDKKYLDYSYPDLLHECSAVTVQLSDANIQQIEMDTQEQAKGNDFFKHRAGRIGASQSKAACHTDPTPPSQSLITSICYPQFSKVITKAIQHGCKHEGDAIQAYQDAMTHQHESFEVSKCGTFINVEHQFLHATPDFLCSCACCGEGCGEVKCPASIEDCDFESYVGKKVSCLEKVEGTYKLKRNHQYYYQVQQQLFTTHKKYCDFVVCAFNGNRRAFAHERIYPDTAFWENNLPKLTTFWRTCVLPEILGKWYSRRSNRIVAGISDDDICYCRMDKEAEPTVTCSNSSCPFSKFHLSCLRITTPTPKTWYCPNCRKLPEFKRSRAKKTTQKISTPGEALAMEHICLCRTQAVSGQKLLKCQGDECDDGRFFHLACLNYKCLPNNRTSWLCPSCRKKKTPRPTPTSTPTPQATPVVTLCPSPTPQPSPRFTPSPTPTPRFTPSPTATFTSQATKSTPPTPTPKFTPSPTFSSPPNYSSNLTEPCISQIAWCSLFIIFIICTFFTFLL